MAVQPAPCECVLLDVQYRMHPSLRAWPSDTFYGGLLTDDASVVSRPQPWAPAESPLPGILPNGARALLVCARAAESLDGTSFANAGEARVVAFVAKQLLTTHKELTVGVIAFYAAQRALVASMFPDGFGGRLLVGTVDGFQGGERDVMLVSAVRTCESVFLCDAKRINVSGDAGQTLPGCGCQPGVCGRANWPAGGVLPRDQRCAFAL